MFGTLLPGMFFSMPGISNSSHSSFFMNQQPIKMAFAQEEYTKLLDEYKHDYVKKEKHDYDYSNYDIKYENNDDKIYDNIKYDNIKYDNEHAS